MESISTNNGSYVQLLPDTINSDKKKEGLSSIQKVGIGLFAASAVVGLAAIALFIAFHKTGSINALRYAITSVPYKAGRPAFSAQILYFVSHIPKNTPLLYTAIATTLLAAGLAVGAGGLVLGSELAKRKQKQQTITPEEIQSVERTHKRKLTPIQIAAITAVAASIVVAAVALGLFIAFHNSSSTLFQKIGYLKTLGYTRRGNISIKAFKLIQMAYSGPVNVNLLRGGIVAASIAAALAAGGTGLLVGDILQKRKQNKLQEI